MEREAQKLGEGSRQLRLRRRNGVCVCVCVCVCVLVIQSCLTLCSLLDCSQLQCSQPLGLERGSSVPGLLQAGILE